MSLFRLIKKEGDPFKLTQIPHQKKEKKEVSVAAANLEN